MPLAAGEDATVRIAAHEDSTERLEADEPPAPTEG